MVGPIRQFRITLFPPCQELDHGESTALIARPTYGFPLKMRFGFFASFIFMEHGYSNYIPHLELQTVMRLEPYLLFLSIPVPNLDVLVEVLIHFL
jgi:hypothetical protein